METNTRVIALVAVALAFAFGVTLGKRLSKIEYVSDTDLSTTIVAQRDTIEHLRACTSWLKGAQR